MTRWLLTSLVLFGFALIGCTPRGDGNKVVPGGGDENKDAKEKKREPDFVTTSEALAKEFVTDKEAAEAKYKGKLVEIAGALGKAPSEVDQFMLNGVKKNPKDPLELEYMVRCIVSPNQYATVARLAKGQRVKAVGSCTPSFTGLFLNVIDCVFTELEPSGILTMTAESLAREFESDKDAAMKKYCHDQDAIIAGVVDDWVKLYDGSYNILLKGTATTRVKFRLLTKDDAVAKGKSVEFRADLTHAFLDPRNEIDLYRRFFMPSK